MCDVAYVLILDECQRLTDGNRLAVAFARANGADNLDDAWTPDEVRAQLDARLAEPLPGARSPARSPAGTPGLKRHDVELRQALGIWR